MGFEHLESPQKILPSAADGVTVTLAASWGAGTWVELTPDTGPAWLLSCFSASPAAAVNANYAIELDFGVGSAGSESVISTYRLMHKGTASGGHGYPMNYQLPVLLDSIYPRSRLAVRGRKDTVTNRGFIVKIGYFEKPVIGHVTTTTKAAVPIPSAANNISVTPSGTAWNNSAWSVLSASAPSDLYITDVLVHAPINNVEAEIDLGVGTAGNEAVITTLKLGIEDAQNTPSCLRLRPILDAVDNGDRLTVRLRKAGTDVTAWNFAVNTIPKPL